MENIPAEYKILFMYSSNATYFNTSSSAEYPFFSFCTYSIVESFWY